MSWDKSTYQFSDITPIVRALMRRNENFYLGVLGNVMALGINDDYRNIEDYDLRVLIYRGGVVLEQMRRTHDCDSDDVITSSCFNFDEVPEKWALERFMDFSSYADMNGNRKQYDTYVLLGKHKKFIKDFLK